MTDPISTFLPVSFFIGNGDSHFFISMYEDLLSKDPTVEELAVLYIQFGDKPTYYINGVEVPHNLVNQLYPNEVVKREFRTTDTASGNPNGEIWYVVTDRALNRIKIPKESTYNYTSNYASSGGRLAPTTGTSRMAPGESNLDEFLKEQERERIKSGLKPMPVVRRVQTPDGGYIETIVEDVNKNEEVAAPSYKDGTSSSSTPPGTRVLSRTVNNTNVGTVEDPVAKALREQRSQPVFRQNNVINIEGQKPAVNNNPLHQPSVTPEEEKTEIKVPESTPRRSVRRIKAKEQSQYQGE